MDEPLLRDGTWWQRHGGQWFHWNPASQQWEHGSAAPPPPPPPPRASAPASLIEQQPARAYTGSGRPLESTSGGSTWSSVTIGTEPVSSSEWPDSTQPAPAPGRGTMFKFGVLAIVALAVAVAFGAYSYFWEAKGPSAEDIDAAFGSLDGYQYEAPPEMIQEQIDALLSEEAMIREHVKEYDYRLVNRGQRLVGVVGIIGYEPGQFGAADMGPLGTQAFLMGFEQTSGLDVPNASVKTVSRSKTTMYELSVAGAATVTFFDDEDGMLFSIVADDARAARDMSKQLAKANL